MLRTVLGFVFSRVLGLFFRRIEVAGAGRVPAGGPTIFAINHPNALVDPLMLLCHAPRPVSFLGKAPLLTMPVIGWFARSLDTIPVYRRQDAADTRQNRETFRRARELLDRGGTIAIAPEGTSHSDPTLRPLKTGAARIALGSGRPVAIVPTGLFYTDKATFRSAALLFFGEPLAVDPVPLDDDGEPPAAATAALTAQIDGALREVIVQADRHEALALAARAEAVLTAALPEPGARGLDEIRRVRQRLIAGYDVLHQREPALLDRLRRRLDRLERAFRLAGLDATRPAAARATPGLALKGAGWFVLRILLFLPLAVPGLIIHYPAYRLTGWLARRLAGEHDDVLATLKIAGSGLLFPLTWLLLGVLAGRWGGWPAGVAAALVAPIAGVAALKLVERFDRFAAGTRAFAVVLFDRNRVATLIRARAEFREEILALADRLETRPDPGPR